MLGHWARLVIPRGTSSDHQVPLKFLQVQEKTPGTSELHTLQKAGKGSFILVVVVGLFSDERVSCNPA